MRGMTEAVYQVARAVRERRRFLVWGDYDVAALPAPLSSSTSCAAYA